MIDADERIREEVERLLPLPAGFAADWHDVVVRARAARGPGVRRKVGLLTATLAATMAILAATPLGAAIARTLGDFSAWMIGEPGTPASPVEQRAFQEANERSWAGFPPGTKLRRLIETTVGGTDFKLYGFRSGDSLCLRLVGSSIGRVALHCAPAHDLQKADTPALVVAADEPLVGADLAGGSDAYMTTFGIVSDGVATIKIHADDGDHQAVVAGNAFLYIADHPQLGTRVRAIDAIAVNGDRAALGFESSPYGMFDLAAPPTGSFHGPSKIERTVSGGTIGWLERLEPRGSDVPAELLERIDQMLTRQADLEKFRGGGSPKPLHRLMARALHPDPSGPLGLVMIAASPSDSMRDPNSQVCQYLILGKTIGGGCNRLHDTFARGPISISMGGSGPSQYTRIAGLASDDVVKVKLYLGDGQTVDVHVQDNFYSAQVARSDFPLRIAAYDAAGRVIALESFRSDGLTSPAPPQARKSVRQLMKLIGPNGGTAVLEAGDVVGGYRCWRLGFGPNAGELGGCTPWPVKGPTLGFIAAYPTQGDHYLAGTLPADVGAVEIRYPDGTTETDGTTDGFLVHLLAAGKLDDRTVIALRAYDPSGNVLAQRGLQVTR